MAPTSDGLFDLHGRVGLVTGAAGRLGSAIVQALAGAGAQVWIGGRTLSTLEDLSVRMRASDIAKLAGVQARLLDAAAPRVKPGGRLVYCVCSLEPEEGESQVEAFLIRHPDFKLDPIAPGEGGAPAASLSPRGWLRILPHHLDGGLDGFFAARLSRADVAG